MQNLSRETRSNATPDDPRYIVYFDGMTDVVTASEFATHTWHVAFAGPLTSNDALENAAKELVLDQLTAEPIFEKSPTWKPGIFKHAFISDNSQDPYCQVMLADNGTGFGPCGVHARYHPNAPENLQNAPARVITRCFDAIPQSYLRKRCEDTPTMVVNKRSYCAPCAALVLINFPQ